MRRWLRPAAAGTGLLLGIAILLRVLPHAPLSTFAPSSTAVYDEHGHLLRLTLSPDEQYRLWTPLADVSPEYLRALELYEDRHFAWHPGIDPAAVLRAAVQTFGGGTRQGASTLTMQLARMLYGLDTRSIGGKLVQMAAAVWLELRYSKAEILEAYVNLAPFGRNIEGVGAASTIFFGKPASRLSFAEALTLAVIPQSPGARCPDGGETTALRAARARLAREWARTYPAGPQALAAAMGPLAVHGIRNLPFEAPHLVDDVLASHAGQAAIHTSIDLPVQHLLERSISRYIAGVRTLGVTNAAALLVDSRTLGVTALVGSADFHDASISGQVNAITAKRSPGSTLKPFIYALAMDQGLIHTRSVLKDAPTAFGVYAPENFDGAFVGPVSAHDALIASRNVPAVWLTSRLAQPSLYQFLQSAGVSRMASEQHYGLALALGGGEVTMEEMAGLYAILANHGRYAPIHELAGVKPPPAVPLLSPEADFMVLSILGDNPRPDGLPNAGPRVAWKTGTSWGFRDAWSAGLVGPYVLVVWVGNFDGSSNPALVGAQMAAPLFFRIVDGLRASLPRLPGAIGPPPPGVVRLDVCAASGDLPNADCPQRTQAWYIPGKSPIRVSTVHRRVAVDTRTGKQACAGTPAKFVREELFEYWPSDIRRLFARAGMPRRRPPVDDCKTAVLAANEPAPAIVTPLSGATYQLRESHSPPDTLPLMATAGSDVRTLYWFADGTFIGASQPSTPLSWTPPRTGEISLSVVDDRGGSAVRDLRVAALP